MAAQSTRMLTSSVRSPPNAGALAACMKPIRALVSWTDYMFVSRPGDEKIKYKMLGVQLGQTTALWLFFLQITLQWSGQDWFNAISGIASVRNALEITTQEEMENFINGQQTIFFLGMAATSLFVAVSGRMLPEIPRQKLKHYASHLLFLALFSFVPLVSGSSAHARYSVLINKLVEGIICAIGFANNESDLVQTMGRRLLTELPAFAAATSALGVGLGTQVAALLSRGEGVCSPLVTFPLGYAVLNYWVNWTSYRVYNSEDFSVEGQRFATLLKGTCFTAQHLDVLKLTDPSVTVPFNFWIRKVTGSAFEAIRFDISHWPVIPAHGDLLMLTDWEPSTNGMCKFKFARAGHKAPESSIILSRSKSLADSRRAHTEAPKTNLVTSQSEKDRKVVPLHSVRASGEASYAYQKPTIWNLGWVSLAVKVICLSGSAVALIQVGDVAATTHLHLQQGLGLTASESSSKLVNMAIGGVLVYGLTFLGRQAATHFGMGTHFQNVLQLGWALLMWHVATVANIALLGLQVPSGETHLDAIGMKKLKSMTYSMSGFLAMSPALKTTLISQASDIHEFQHLFAIQGFFEEAGKFLQTMIEPLVQSTVVCGDHSRCDKVATAAQSIAQVVQIVLICLIPVAIGTQLVHRCKSKVLPAASEPLLEA